MIDKKRFAKNMTALTETLGSEELSKGRIGTYWAILEEFDDELVENALKTCAKTLRFFPKPVDILEILQGTGKSKDQLCIEAYDALMTAIKRYGSYQSVLFADGKIAKTIELLGGWLKICETWTEEESKWQRIEFSKIYNALGDHQAKVVEGRYALDNQTRGFIDHIPQPFLVGNDKKQLEYDRPLLEPVNEREDLP